MNPLLSLVALGAALGLAACSAADRGSDAHMAMTHVSAPANDAPTNDAMVPGFTSHTIESSGQSLGYVVYVPRDYDGSKPMPMILFLHGAGECGSDGWKQVGHSLGLSIMHDASRWPFIVVFPQKPTPKQQWESYDPQVMGILDAVEHTLKVDTRRVYLTGLSQGGHGTWMIAAAHPGLFAAIAPISAYGDQAAIVPKLGKMPIWYFHGELDDTVKVPPAKALVEALTKARDAGAEPIKTSYYPRQGHDDNMWNHVFAEKDLPTWFLAHSLP